MLCLHCAGTSAAFYVEKYRISAFSGRHGTTSHFNAQMQIYVNIFRR